MDGLDWIGLDLSQNITPPRAPCGANNFFFWMSSLMHLSTTQHDIMCLSILTLCRQILVFKCQCYWQVSFYVWKEVNGFLLEAYLKVNMFQTDVNSKKGFPAILIGSWYIGFLWDFSTPVFLNI